MENVRIGWLGICQYDNHNKFWGWMEAEGGYYCFWGRRGQDVNPRFKHHDSLESVKRMEESKKKKNYREIPVSSYTTEMKDINDLAIKLVLDILSDKVL